MSERTSWIRSQIARKRFAVRRRIDRLPRREDRAGPCPPLVKLLSAYGPGRPAPDVLYFGGSESLEVSWSDWSKKPLGRMVRQRLAPLRMCQITHIAYHSHVYLALLRALETMPGRPRVIMVPICLRQSSPQWRYNPNYRFDELIDAAERYASNPAGEIPVIPPFPRRTEHSRSSRNPEEWQRYLESPASYPGRSERTVGDFLGPIFEGTQQEQERSDRMRLSYAFNYLFPLDENDERLQAAREVLVKGEELGCEVICWLHPINHESGRQLLGPAMDESLDAKVDAAKRACGPAARIHDWTRLLPASCFYDSVEHFNEVGRARVADAMLAAVRDVLPIDQWSRPRQPQRV